MKTRSEIHFDETTTTTETDFSWTTIKTFKSNRIWTLKTKYIYLCVVGLIFFFFSLSKKKIKNNKKNWNCICMGIKMHHLRTDTVQRWNTYNIILIPGCVFIASPLSWLQMSYFLLRFSLCQPFSHYDQPVDRIYILLELTCQRFSLAVLQCIYLTVN